MIDFKDKTMEAAGTPINRAHLMAMQGFIAKTTVFGTDGTITETNADGHTLTTEFLADGTIKETFVGIEGKTLVRTTTFNPDGSITETVQKDW